MSNNTNKKTSFAAAFKNNLRAWKILFKPCKGIFVSIFLSAFTAAASPLVTIWFSAQLLNELAGSRNPAALRNWVLLTLGAINWGYVYPLVFLFTALLRQRVLVNMVVALPW